MEPEASTDTAQPSQLAQPIDGPAKKDIENEVSSILASRSEENVKAVALKLVFHVYFIFFYMFYSICYQSVHFYLIYCFVLIILNYSFK